MSAHGLPLLPDNDIVAALQDIRLSVAVDGPFTPASAAVVVYRRYGGTGTQQPPLTILQKLLLYIKAQKKCNMIVIECRPLGLPA